MDDWFRLFYGEHYANSVREALTADRSKAEVKFILEATGVRPPDTVADIGCGNGRHSRPLARSGLNVLALDQNPDYIAEGEALAGDGPRPNFLVQDMREPVGGPFHLVLSLFSSFGFFSDEENKLMLSKWVQCIRPGGIFLLDHWNREAMIRNYTPVRSRRVAKNLVVTEEAAFDPLSGRIDTHHLYIYDDGPKHERRASFRFYSASEARLLLEGAGLTVDSVYGSLQGGEYSLESERMVLLARKIGYVSVLTPKSTVSTKDIPERLLDPDRFLRILDDPWYRLLINLQDRVSVTTTKFWSGRGLRTLHLPVTTNSISSPMGRGSDSVPVKTELFGVSTYLADSMQFMLEYGCRFCEHGAYYVMPSFRGESADESHLCQFFHSEVEIPGDLETAMCLAEDYLRSLCNGILETLSDELVSIVGDVSHVERFASRQIEPQRWTFDEVVRELDNDVRFVIHHKGDRRREITRAGEQQMLRLHGDFIWITHWDHLSVPFYQASVPGDSDRALNADLLFGIGEVIGLGQRHENAVETEAALARHGVGIEPYRWYVALKGKFPLKTSGFGMGVERFLLWVLKHHDIRDLQIVPRFNGLPTLP